MKRLISLFLILSALASQGQEKRAIPDIEIYSGFDGGWWLYNLGTTNDIYYNTEGWGRSYASPSFNFGLSLIWEIKRFQIGAGFDRTWFLENEMVGAEHADRNYDLYKISDGVITYWSYYGMLAFRIAEARHFSLSPMVRIGGFQIESLHPEQGNLKNKWYLQAGANLNWDMKKWALVFRPYFRSRHMKPKIGLQNESHTIIGFGGELGWRWKW